MKVPAPIALGAATLLVLAPGSDAAGTATNAASTRTTPRRYTRTIQLSAPPPIAPPSPTEKKAPARPALKQRIPAPSQDFIPLHVAPPATDVLRPPAREQRGSRNWILPPPPEDLEGKNRESMPALRGWGWLADSVLSLQQQSSAAEEEEETESTEPETYLPLLSPGTPEGRSSSPFSLLAPESRPSTFTPVRELGTLSSTGSTNRSPLIRRPADTAADLAPRYAAESTPRSSAVTANHPPPETAPAHFPAGELPYSSLRPAKERTARLSRTEELLAETKQKLFGRIPTALPTARPQVPAFRPTGDFQSSAFRDFTRFRPSREPGLFGPSAAEGVGSGLAEVHPSASLSGPRTATGGLPGFQFTPQGGSRLKLEAPAYAPSHLSAQRQSADSLNRVHSGSKLIDKFLNLPEPEY